MPKRPFSIGFIGCGNMAQAVILGLLENKILSPSNIFATNRSRPKLKRFAAQAKIRFCRSNEELVERAQIIFLATKPQDSFSVFEEVQGLIRNDQIIVSLAAGLSGDVLRNVFPKARSIFRVMGNTAASVQKGVFGIYLVNGSRKDELQIFEIFDPLGLAVRLRSDKEVDILTSGAASGTGFALYLMEAFALWFQRQGLGAKDARNTAVETFLGAAELAKKRPAQSLTELLAAVTSKKGTTFAGLKTMKKLQVSRNLQTSLGQAFQRAQELAKSLRQTRK